MWLQYSLCYYKYIYLLFRLYLAFNSLVVATMRYTFVVNQHRVFLFGVEKTKNMFYYLSLVIPMVIGVLHACTFHLPVKFTSPREFSLQYPTHSVCIDYYRKSHIITDFNFNTNQSVASPIYSFVHQYISTEITYYVGQFVLVLMAIIASNVVEGILYWNTFATIKR